MFQNLTLDEALHVSTVHLDGVRIREELMFWNALQGTIDRLDELFAEDQEERVSNAELHQKFFELGKMLGGGIRKYRSRLNQCEYLN